MTSGPAQPIRTRRKCEHQTREWPGPPRPYMAAVKVTRNVPIVMSQEAQDARDADDVAPTNSRRPSSSWIEGLLSPPMALQGRAPFSERHVIQKLPPLSGG